MFMARALKTYITNLGFFELAISAPSMKAALEAAAMLERPVHWQLPRLTRLLKASSKGAKAASDYAPARLLRRRRSDQAITNRPPPSTAREAGSGTGVGAFIRSKEIFG